MSVSNPRNKLVNFRLSDQEFQKLGIACNVSGARSLSDFARTAVLSAVLSTETSPSASPGSSERSFDDLVVGLESRLTQLLQLLDAVQPPMRQRVSYEEKEFLASTNKE